MKLHVSALMVLVCTIAAFLAGIFAAKRDIAPVPQLASLVRPWTSESDTARVAMAADDVESIIAINSRAQALEKPEALKAAIGSAFVSPQVVSGKGLRFARRDLVETHRTFRFEMQHGMVSNVHYLQPAKYNRRIFILHGGHDSWPEDFGAEVLIAKLLQKGFGVALFSMPLTGYNSQRLSVKTDRFGPIELTNHNAFFFIETDQFSPIGAFIDPVLAFVRFADDQSMADNFAMGGLSGGGWTTVVAAALEPRISHSYVIAGTSPEFLTPHVVANGWGDYEQTNMRMLRAANYLEMYTLATLEPERRQVHLFARNDPCCWNGPDLGIYERPVQQRLSKLVGGRFAVAIDEKSTEHSYTDFARDFVLADLTRK